MCGEVDPVFLSVPDVIWPYYVPDYERRGTSICRSCLQQWIETVDALEDNAKPSGDIEPDFFDK